MKNKKIVPVGQKKIPGSIDVDFLGFDNCDIIKYPRKMYGLLIPTLKQYKLYSLSKKVFKMTNKKYHGKDQFITKFRISTYLLGQKLKIYVHRPKEIAGRNFNKICV